MTATMQRLPGRPHMPHRSLPSTRRRPGNTYPSKRTAAKRGSNRAFRGDIQGLRAVAVVVVIMDHLWSWPRGGFVGVDIFFVISGYLITGLLLREMDKTGRISYLDFYRRRIRRILPLAVLVLGATVGASYLLFRSVRANIVTGDALWALGFLANWHFAVEKTDYFNNEELTSPLQHYWSLSVEEQFYVVWPLILIVFALLIWKTRFGRVALGGTLLVVVAVSMAYGWWQTANEPTVAYFATPVRVWELAIGALLAVLQPGLKRIPPVLARVLSWAGLAGIAASLVLISASSAFPVPWAALPVAAAALVIAAGSGAVQYQNPVLDNGVGRYVGDISYSLYLWHFPIIILADALFLRAGPIEVATVIAVTAVLSVLSFHLVEDPIRRSAWLEPRRTRRQKVRYRDTFDSRAIRAVQLSGAMLCIGGTVAIAGLAINHASALPRSSVDALNRIIQPVSDVSATLSSAPISPKTFEGRLQVQIQAALQADAFPTLSPSIDQLPDNKAPQWTVNKCGTTGAWNAELCTYGPQSATKSVAVIGDSIALSWLPGLIKAFNSKGYRVHSFVAGECPAADVVVGRKQSSQDICRKHREWAISAISEMRPDRIVLSDASFLVPMLSDNASGDDAVSEWATGLRRTLARLIEVAPISILSAPPGSKNLIDCANRGARPANCELSRTNENSVALARAEARAVDGLPIEIADATDWFCGRDACPSFVGTTPVYVDGIHMTRQYSEYLAPALVTALKITQ